MITNKVNEFRKIKGQQEHTWQLGYVNETTLRLLGKKKIRLHGAENYIKMLTPRRDWKLENR